MKFVSEGMAYRGLSGNDPLRFFYRKAAENNLRLRATHKDHNSSKQILNGGDINFLGHYMATKKNPDGHIYGLSVHLTYFDPTSGSLHHPKRMDVGMRAYVCGVARSFSGKTIHNLNLTRDDLSEVDPYMANIGVCFNLVKTKNQRKSLTKEDDWDNVLVVEVFPHLSSSTKRIDYWADWLNVDTDNNAWRTSDIDSLQHKFGGDKFEPYLHRIAEIYAGVPREQWHSPNIYFENKSDESLDQIVDSGIAELFVGDERQKLEAQIKEARLVHRNDWASVPRMNLGLVKLPNIGDKKRNYDFAIGVAPILIEYVSGMGLMDRERAEEIVAQRLVQKLVHCGDFQLGRDQALEVIASFSKNDSIIKEVAA